MSSNKMVDVQNWWDEEDTRIDIKIFTTRRDIPIYIMNVKPFVHVSDGFLSVERNEENATNIYVDESIVLYFEIVPVPIPKHYDYD